MAVVWGRVNEDQISARGAALTQSGSKVTDLPTVYWDCPGKNGACGMRVPNGQQCNRCAVADVEQQMIAKNKKQYGKRSK